MSYSNAYIWNLEKMVLKNLFTGQQWRKRHRGQTYRHGENDDQDEHRFTVILELETDFVIEQ